MSAAASLSEAEAASATGRAIATTTPLDLLRANGYVIFDRLLSEPVVWLSEELEPRFAATPRCQAISTAGAPRLARHPLMLSIRDSVLRPHCDWYQLSLTQAVRLHPGQRQQVPRRDEETWPCQKNAAEYLVNAMWALSDFTAENGATMLWPPSQFDTLSHDLRPESAVIAEMRRGSALVYLGSLTHCGGANKIDHHNPDGHLEPYN